MTSTTGKADTTQHPDVSEIADLTEGLLSPSRSSAVRRHLDDCPLCADVRTSLEEIRGLLGTLPGPPRMPAEIAGRIDAALAAEALLHATAPDSASSVSRETSRPDPDPAPEPLSLSTSSTSTSGPTSRPAGHSRAATGPGRPGTPRRRRIALFSTLGAAFGAVILGTSLFLAQSGGLPTAGDATKKADTAASAALSPFSGAPVEERVRSLLAENEAARTPRGIGPESMSAEGGTTTPQRNRDASVPSCVLAGTGRTDGVLAQEKGAYDGRSAYLLVLTDPADATRVQVYVLAAACAEGPESAGNNAAELLLTRSFPRS